MTNTADICPFCEKTVKNSEKAICCDFMYQIDPYQM